VSEPPVTGTSVTGICVSLAQQVAADMGIPADKPMTPEQFAVFSARIAGVVSPGEVSPGQVAAIQDALDDLKDKSVTWLEPLVRPLTQGQLRFLVRECAVAVALGETLIIQVGDGHTPNQMRELQESLNWRDPGGEPDLPFRTVVVPGDSLGIVAPGDMEDAVRRLVRDELDAALARADRAAVADDDLGEAGQ
jgi:hypothetical protein